jgi:Ca2+-binding RTX toxin-like protein
VTARSGGTIVTTTPDGITNAFAGVVSFNVSGLTPGGSTQATINFPTGLAAGSGNAYVRFNYATNRFEEYVDASGNPLYKFVDSDGDGVLDAVNLTLVDGDQNWDGDGQANGTVVDPGFLGSGERIITGTKRGDTLTGNVLANTIYGKKGKDWLVGDLGNDILKGSLGNDRLYGGEGADQITGGQDKDRFIYTLASDSSTSLRDTVKFGQEDCFVFSSFDGDSTTEGQQKLSFIGKQAFSGVAGELRATRSVLEADLNGDSIADFAINLRGNTLISSSNLVL